MSIIDFIPFGHENAVTYSHLMLVMGESKREVRRQLNKAKKEFMICNLQDGKGFFRPIAGDEDFLIIRYFRQELHRNMEHFATLKPFQEYLRSIE